MSWWRSNPSMMKEFETLLSHFPYLRIVIENEKIYLVGDWPVFGESQMIKTFHIKIAIPDDYPLSVPKVYEIDDAIPKIQDRHFNPKDGTACLFLNAERAEHCPPGTKIDAFLNGPVKEFFFSQAYFDLTGSWPFGCWAHGDEGVIEFCLYHLQITKLSQLIKFLKLLALKKPSKRRCPCGNGKQLKSCHWQQFSDLRVRLTMLEWASVMKLLISKQNQS